jgi:hypothetical protein
MVDEMRYNDIGNEVTLIKRFTSSSPNPHSGKGTAQIAAKICSKGDGPRPGFRGLRIEFSGPSENG